MPTRNVVLTDYQEQFIAGLVDSGRYKNASEVMREAIRVFERKENSELAQIAALKEAIIVGEADFATGNYDEYSPMLLNQLADEVRAEVADERQQTAQSAEILR